jgi:hypothetical protein
MVSILKSIASIFSSIKYFIKEVKIAIKEINIRNEASEKTKRNKSTLNSLREKNKKANEKE